MTTPDTHQLTFADWTTRVLRTGSGREPGEELGAEPGAEPLVLLHSHGVDADMWLPLIDALPAGVPVLALDLRGQGASTNQRRPVSLELLADDVIAVLEREGVRRCTVVGLALGGTVAQLVATRAPRLTARLVLMDTAATRTPQSRQSLLDRAALAEGGGLTELIDAAIPRWFPQGTPAPDPAVLAGLRTMMERIDPVEYAAVGRAFADLELRDNAALIGCPTLVVVGAEDVAMPVAQSQLLHELIPQSELVVLPAIGHCPPLQDPALVARLLTGFVAGAGHSDRAGGPLWERGLRTRRAVLGADYVDRSLNGADDFMMAFQRVTTEWCWGFTWNRPALDRRTRSLLNLVMLTALGKPNELRSHVRGALHNGVSVEEIREALLHATTYCGIPAGLEAFSAAHAVLVAEGALPGSAESGSAESADHHE